MSEAKILIVEDNSLLRDIYVDILTGAGYDIEVAIDGKEAFEKIHQGGWDLVLLDVVLPKLQGFEVIKKLQTDPAKIPNKKIVFMTNIDDPKEVDEAKSLVQGIIRKSEVTPEELLKIVKQYLKI